MKLASTGHIVSTQARCHSREPTDRVSLTFPERLSPPAWPSSRASTVVIPVIDLESPAADLMLVQVLHSLHGHRLVVVLAEGVALGLPTLLVLHHPVEVWKHTMWDAGHSQSNA